MKETTQVALSGAVSGAVIGALAVDDAYLRKDIRRRRVNKRLLRGAIIGVPLALFVYQRGQVAQAAMGAYGVVAGYADDTVAVLFSRFRIKEGVLLNRATKKFANRLAAMVPDVKLTVTSGIRTAESQAKSMAYNRVNKGDANQRNLYRSQPGLIGELLAVPATTAAMTPVLQAQIKRGRFISRHLRGDAIDIRVHGLTSDQRTRIRAAAAKLGATSVDEGDHIHVGHIEKGAGKVLTALTTVTGTEGVGAGMFYVVRRVPWWMWVAGAGWTVLLGTVLVRRRRRL